MSKPSVTRKYLSHSKCCGWRVFVYDFSYRPFIQTEAVLDHRIFMHWTIVCLLCIYHFPIAIQLWADTAVVFQVQAHTIWVWRRILHFMTAKLIVVFVQSLSLPLTHTLSLGSFELQKPYNRLHDFAFRFARTGFVSIGSYGQDKMDKKRTSRFLSHHHQNEFYIGFMCT